VKASVIGCFPARENRSKRIAQRNRDYSVIIVTSVVIEPIGPSGKTLVDNQSRKMREGPSSPAGLQLGSHVWRTCAFAAADNAVSLRARIERDNIVPV